MTEAHVGKADRMKAWTRLLEKPGTEEDLSSWQMNLLSQVDQLRDDKLISVAEAREMSELVDAAFSHWSEQN